MWLVLGAGLGTIWSPLGSLLLVVDLLLLVAVLWDRLLTPNPAEASVERDLPVHVGLSQPLTRVLRVQLPRNRELALAVHEEYPASFRVEHADSDADVGSQPDRAVTDADGSALLTRTYTPERRGLHSLGSLRLVLSGPLGLVERSALLAGPQNIRVEPALVDLSRILALAASDRWQDLGVRRLRQRGGETEFESLREYVPGDEVRRVDWKAFARRGVPMVREHEVERGQELFLLIDRGRRMRALAGRAAGTKTTAGADASPDASTYASTYSGGTAWSKMDWALEAALQLAAVAIAKGDRVGIATFEQRIDRWVSPARGRGQMRRLASAVFECQATDRESNLERALSELGARHRRRATVLILSDVADPLTIPRQRRALGAASKRHKIVFAALDDPDLRRAALGQGENGVEISAALQAASLELLEDRRRGLKGLGGRGVRVLDAIPAELAGPLLSAWLDARHDKPVRAR
ncbi:MAG: hypothetical protein ACI8QS_002903 [Planctomycetota bacterium]|jgi:uncharacterized protein (DUF58 family)